MIVYLKNFESLFVILGNFVCSDKLDVVTITRVSHDVILQRRNDKRKREVNKVATQMRCVISHITSINSNKSHTVKTSASNSVLCHPQAGPRIALGMKYKEAGVMVQKRQTVTYTKLSSLQHPLYYVIWAHASDRSSITTDLHKSRSDWHCGLRSAISGCRYYVYGLFLMRVVMAGVVKGMRLCVSSAHIAVAG